MNFRYEDIVPNQPIPLARVRAGATSDARWRCVVLDGDVTISRSVVHDLERQRFEHERWGMPR